MLLGEEVLLLLLNEKKDQLKKGTLDHSDLNYLLPATIIADLQILGRIKIESEGKKATILLIDNTATNNHLLDEHLSNIAHLHEQGQYFNFVKFMQAVGHKKQKWQERFWKELENNGIIQNEKKKHKLVKPEVKEKLVNDRDNARLDYEAQVETQMLLPITYSLFMQNLIEQQQKIREEMPEDKRQQLDDLLKGEEPKA